MAQTEFQQGITAGQAIQNVITWVLQGQSLDDITEAIPAELNKTDIIKAAFDQISQRPSSRGDLLSWHIECRRELYRESMRISDFKAAHAILVDLAKLDHVYTTAAPRQQKEAPAPDTRAHWDRLKMI